MESFIDRIIKATHFVLTLDFGASSISVPLDFDGGGLEFLDGCLSLSSIGGTDGWLNIKADKVVYDVDEDEYSVIEEESGAKIVFSNIQ